MDVQELAGLRIGVLAAEEAVGAGPPAAYPGLDLLRVPAPAEADWARLAAAGFVVKPDRVTWLAGTGADEREFLARISRKEREDVARARRAADRAGLALRTVPLDPAQLEEFLGLYERAVALMPHGLPVARRHGAAILAGIDRFFLVRAEAGGELRGAVIGERCPAAAVARARFSAVAPELRAGSLSRVLYLELVRAARDAGYARVSLGNDPNLYGHLVQPGLLAFKARLGFVPTPSTAVDPADGEDVADRVLSLKALADPAVMLGYPGPGDRSLRHEVFSRDARPDTTLLTTCLPAPVRTHRVT